MVTALHVQRCVLINFPGVAVRPSRYRLVRGRMGLRVAVTMRQLLGPGLELLDDPAALVPATCLVGGMEALACPGVGALA